VTEARKVAITLWPKGCAMSGERTTAVIKRYLGEIAGDSPPSRSSRDLLDRAVRDCTDGLQNGRAARPPGPGPAAPTPPGSQDRPASSRLTPRPPGSPARPSSQAGLPLRTIPAHNGGDGQRHQDQRSRLGDRIDLDEERPRRGPDLPGRPAIIFLKMDVILLSAHPALVFLRISFHVDRR